MASAGLAIAEQRDVSPRQREVLAAALEVLVSAGDRLTMNAVAARASCSKETLYKWFGDRDGLLAAMIGFHAARVRVGAFEAAHLDRGGLYALLEGFAGDLLGVLTGPVSIALNRLAIAEAGRGNTPMGQALLSNGRFALGRRLKPALEAGIARGLLRAGDAEAAFRDFYGLVVRDVHLRVLAGEAPAGLAADLGAQARRATEQFFALYGA